MVNISDDLTLSTGKFDGIKYEYIWTPFAEGSYAYDEELETFVIEYGEGHKLISANSDLYILADLCGDKMSFLISTFTGDKPFGNWSSGKTSLEVNDEVVYGENTYEFMGFSVMLTYANKFVPAIVFGTDAGEDSELYIGLFDDTSLVLYDGLSEELDFVEAFVPETYIDMIVGSYYYYGEFGRETVSFSEKGVLTVDTLNETKTGIIPVVYDYEVEVIDNLLRVAFEVETDEGTALVPLMFDGAGHCSIGDISYLSSDYAAIQGLYSSISGNYLSVADTNIYYNGEKFSLSSSLDGVLSGYFGFDYYFLSFKNESVTITPMGFEPGDPVTLEMSETKLSTFKTDVQKKCW